MKRNTSLFFLRSYFAIVLGIVIVALTLDSLLLWFVGAEVSDERHHYRDSFALIERLLLDDAADAESAGLLLAQSLPDFEQVLGVPATLLMPDDFAGQDDIQRALDQGQVVSLFDSRDRETFYRRMPPSQHILALGPISAESRGRKLVDLLVMSAYYFLVAFVVFLWIRPFYRDLAVLRQAAGQFGKDDFSTRIDLPRSSNILPVAQSFNAMAERIQHLVSAHKELTSAVSHELRTPLARFKFSLQMLSGNPSEENRQRYLNDMKLDVLELESLTEEMLSYARLSESNLVLSMSRVDIREWTQRQLRQYEDEEVRIQCRFEKGPGEGPGNDWPKLTFDPDMMARALHNVLRNSLRYADTEVTLTVQLTEETAELRVSDDGPGVPEEMRSTIFEPFSRLDTSRDRQSGGHGLGLAIAQRIVQRHGGGIDVQPNAPKGACFVLRWPLTLPPSLDGSPAQQA